MKRKGAKTQFARHLRRGMTDAETRLWFHLRCNRLEGFHFRRQHPVGPLVADFMCVKAQLIIEIDGSQHLDSSQDEIRDRWLSENGYRILRFWNHDVLKRADKVLGMIVESLIPNRPHPPSAPFPAAQGKGKRGKGAR